MYYLGGFGFYQRPRGFHFNGDMSFSHVLQVKGVELIAREYDLMVEKGGLGTVEFLSGQSSKHAERIRRVWKAFIYFVRAHKGPFWRTKDSIRQERMLDLACQIFPDGPPKDGCKWMRSDSEGAANFALLYEFLLGRSAPAPLTNLLK